MPYKIKRWDTDDVIHEYGENAKECLEHGVENGVSFYRARLEGARLSGAMLRGAMMDGARLEGARMSGAWLDGAWLDGASLDGATLSGATLSGARMSGAILDGAMLEGARMSGARMSGAILSGARMSGAMMSGAMMRGAMMDGAMMRDAKGIVRFGPVGNEELSGYAVKHKTCVMIKLGCFWDTSEKAIKAVSEKYGADSDYVNRIRAAVKKLEGAE